MIDLRSDTVTRPTRAMREAMMNAPVGDDVYGDDPTVNELEALAAQVTGKEAALFVPSGTMGNQLAIMTHTRPGQEIITGLHSHIIQHEAGGHARLSGVSAMTVDTDKGPITPEDVLRCLRDPEDIHHPVSSLLCLENAMSNGTVVSVEQTASPARAAHQHGLKVHLDGARLFNAAAAQGVKAADLVKEVDSVMFCLSKGLCAPVGSMLCGTREFIARARRNRKILGGGLRQAGVLAACGLIAIREMTGRLEEDHRNAKALALALSQVSCIHVDISQVQTNMVWAKITAPGLQDAAFTGWLKTQGILINGDSSLNYRFVTHHDVNHEELLHAAGLIRQYMGKLTV
jgi:threonine aldolase